jgi:Flp pilus assembly secretin CpaC
MKQTSIQMSHQGGVALIRSTALIRSMLTIGLVLALVVIAVPSARAEDALIVQAGHGRLLRLNNVQRVVVAAPDIADVNVVSRNELMIIAKRVGETTLNVWMPSGVTTYRVVVIGASGADIGEAIKEALGDGSSVRVRVVGETVMLEGSVKDDAAKARAETIASAFSKRVINLLTPEQPAIPPAGALEEKLRDALKDYPVVITATSNDGVRIEGVVPTQYDLQRIDTIAKAYAKNVVLMVRVRTPVQVQIATIVAEINRSALNDLGVQYGGGDATNGLVTPYLFNFGYVTNGNIALQLLTARLHLLESRNAARTLANPRLVVLEGQTSKLLVGGEVPIPLAGPLGVPTLTFKEFGIRLEFKPIVHPDEPIQLDLVTEVSSLDFTNAVVVGGFSVPTIKSRRVQTVVSMRPGEYLAIGGLIQREDTKVVTKIPLLGDIPILGALFRSESFNRGETELVIFVTPSLVTPTTEVPALPQTPNPNTLNP